MSSWVKSVCPAETRRGARPANPGAKVVTYVTYDMSSWVTSVHPAETQRDARPANPGVEAGVEHPRKLGRLPPEAQGV